MADYIKKDGSLTSHAVAVYVNAMLSDKVDNLPTKLYEHVQNSPSCIAKVVEAYDWALEIQEDNGAYNFELQ